mmetsp:Transcript_116785/g.268031  ORF Transcript_116785/g.268031 Transcript_116785/m.268031 type:complete len:426 (+) Transcript_116785:84-1361(+)
MPAQEFRLITEDPFWVDQRVFELWLQGHSEERALQKRMHAFTSDEEVENQDHLKKLLADDTHNQFEAFRFLEATLEEPHTFLDTCPMQMSVAYKKLIARTFYNLDPLVSREIVRSLGAVASDTKKRRKVQQEIVKRTGVSENKVERHLENYRRVRQLFDKDKESGVDAEHASVQIAQLLGEELEAEYRRLHFLVTWQFRLEPSKKRKDGQFEERLQYEQVDDVAAILLVAFERAPEKSMDQIDRFCQQCFKNQRHGVYKEFISKLCDSYKSATTPGRGPSKKDARPSCDPKKVIDCIKQMQSVFNAMASPKEFRHFVIRVTSLSEALKVMEQSLPNAISFFQMSAEAMDAALRIEGSSESDSQLFRCLMELVRLAVVVVWQGGWTGYDATTSEQPRRGAGVSQGTSPRTQRQSPTNSKRDPPPPP